MSSCNTDQQEKSSSKTIDSKTPTSIKHCQDLPEEKNGQVKGTRITDELLEYFRQQNEEMKRCRRKYDMAVYKVYGTVPWADNPPKLEQSWLLPTTFQLPLWNYTQWAQYEIIDKVNRYVVTETDTFNTTDKGWDGWKVKSCLLILINCIAFYSGWG